MNTATDFTDMSMSDLVKLYKELTGKTIKKFDSKKKGIDRIKKLMADKKIAADPVKKQEASVRDGRADKVAKLLRQGELSVPELMEKFDTNYKNITGTLFNIRHERGFKLKPGEQLTRVRRGMKSYYSLEKSAE